MTTGHGIVRQARMLMAQRAAQVAAAALFAFFIPRLMGPDDFGRYALMTSVSMWFALLSGLGATSMLTRIVPAIADDADRLSHLVTSLIALRALSGVASAVMYLVVTLGWFGDLDVVALVFMAGAVLGRTAGNPAYALFLGLNRAARWGVGDLLRRWLTLVFVIAGFLAAGIRGACFGVLAANVVVLALGIWWARPYLNRRYARVDLAFLRPFLRIGTAFAAGNLLLALAHRTGEAMVRIVTSDYGEVGQFAAAYAVYLTGADAVWHLTIAFAPMLVAQYGTSQLDDVRAWIERILRVTVIASGVALIGAAWIGDLAVRALFGAEFSRVALNLVPMSIGLVALAFGSGARLAALVANRPGLSAQAALIEVVIFWAAGIALTSRWGSVGASIASAASVAAYAAFLTLRLRSGVLRYPIARPLTSAAIAVVIAAASWWAETPVVRLAATPLMIAVYVAALWQCGALSAADIRTILRRPAAEDDTDAPL